MIKIHMYHIDMYVSINIVYITNTPIFVQFYVSLKHLKMAEKKERDGD